MQANETGRRTKLIGIAVFAALAVVVTVAVAPRAKTNGASTGIDVTSISKNAKNLPEEQFPAY